jgi:transcriptional regulator with XRE-family HTH domain
MAKRVKGPHPRGRHFIAEWRLSKGLSQAQLAELMETSGASISRVETYESAYTQDFLEACAHALGCRPQDLIAGPPNAPDPLLDAIEKLQPAQRRQALRLIAALSEEPEPSVKSSGSAVATSNI